MFRQARIKLTVYYMLIFSLILIGFTALTFQAKNSAFVKVSTTVARYDTTGQESLELNARLEEYTDRFQQRVILFDLVLWLVAARLSWALSGKTLKPIREMMVEQRAFAADVSHGLRTPLATMSLEIEAFIRTRKFSTEVKNLLDSLLEEIGYLKRITEGVLSLTRQNRDDQAKTAVQLNPMLESLVRSMRPAAGAKKQKLELTLSAPIQVLGVEDQLKQVVTILIDNAIKYGGQKTRINVSARAEKSLVKIVVADNGPGIELTELKAIFERFSRGKGAAKLAKGAGLGLSIAKQIIKAHGGELIAKSRVGRGTTMLITLPTNS